MFHFLYCISYALITIRKKKLKEYMLDNYGMSSSETRAFLKENPDMETLDLYDGTVLYLKHELKQYLGF